MAMFSERRLTLTQAARKLSVNSSTTWRWALDGVRGVKLRTFSVGARRYTTDAAIEEFVTATTAVAAGEQPLQRSSRQREAAVAHAERELRGEGI